jgi:serine protease Do
MRLIPITALSLAIAASLIGGLFTATPANADSKKATQQRAALMLLQDAFTSIVDEVSPSVVSISSKQKVVQESDDDNGLPDIFRSFPFGPQVAPQQQQVPATSYGTGIIIRSDGYVLTNDHVVGDADSVKVTLKDGREFDGTVLKDPSSDLDLIKINAKDLPAAKLGDSSKVKVGSWAIAIGNPFRLNQTVTLGVISAIGRQEAVENKFYPNLIQTDASINPGNSGGPLVNIEGEVIGINTLIRSESGGNIGIGFAIPVNTAKFVINSLIKSGKVVRGFLGINPTDLTPKQYDRYGVKKGAFVQSVSEGTPAQKAGIQVEDIIIKFGDREINNELDLRDAISQASPGTDIPIVVIRQGKTITFHVQIAERDKQEASAAPSIKETINKKLGFAVADLDPQIAKENNIDPDTKGVVVTKVAQPGVAMEAGLRPGAIILRANGKSVATVDDLVDVVKTLQSGDSLVLVVKAARSTYIIELPIE